MTVAGEKTMLGVHRAAAVSGTNDLPGLARALERDVKRVREDVGTLVEFGLVEKTGRGKVQVPYGVIEAAFALRAA